MEIVVLFVLVIGLSVALGLGLWCADQGAKAKSYFDDGLLRVWLVVGMIALARTTWTLLTEPDRLDEALALCVLVAGLGGVFTLFFWVGHWRTRGARVQTDKAG